MGVMNYCIIHKVIKPETFLDTIHWCQEKIEWENPFKWNRDVYTSSGRYWECSYYFNNASNALWFLLVWS